jgi:hypothetical protein
MGHLTSTRTHTHIKPIPVLTGVGTGRYGYGYRQVMRVWKPAWVGMVGLRQLVPSPLCCSPFPPREQLLAAVVGGATVVVAMVPFTAIVGGA